MAIAKETGQYSLDFDIHHDNVQLHNQLKYFIKKNEQLGEQNDYLQSENRHIRGHNLILEAKCNNLEHAVALGEERIHSLRNILTAQTNTVLVFVNKTPIVNLDQIHSQDAIQQCSVAHANNVCTCKQEEICELKKKVKQLQKELERKNKEQSTAMRCMLTLQKKVLKLKCRLRKMPTMNTFFMKEYKVLHDEIGQMKAELTFFTETPKADSLVNIRYGRFEVAKNYTECSQCHQNFGSSVEMEASTCVFHPANSSSTGITGKYFWRCCQVEAFGKSSPGCQEGKHIPCKHLNGNIT